jgi:NuA3 HAT complex component NTO1
LSQIFLSKLAESDNLDPESSADINTIHQKLNEVPAGTAEHHALSHDQKELKKLAKRIVKAVKELTEGAVKKEAELRGLQHGETMRKIESFALFSADVTKSIEPDAEDSRELTKRRSVSNASAVAGASPDVKADVDVEMHDADGSTEDAVASKPTNLDNPTPASMPVSSASSTHSHTVKTNSSKPTEPLSPPISTASAHRPGTANGNHTQSGENDPFTNGGVAWYLTPFDPMGTTVHEERYTGREVMRDMTDELSDMDEDALMDLGASRVDDSVSGAAGSNGSTAAGAVAGVEKVNNATPVAKKKQPKRKSRRW